MATERERLANELFDILLAQGCLTDEIKQRFVIALDAYEVQQRTTDVAPVNPTDNAALIKRFMVAKAVAGRSQKTIKQYVDGLNKFIRMVNKQLLDVTPDDVRAYLAHRMIDDGIYGATLANERSYVSTFYDWAVGAELLNRNPVRMTDPIKLNKAPKKAFSELELEQLRGACKTLKEKALIEALLSTACRVAELASIRTCDIDGCRIMVQGKGGKYGQVYINSKAAYAIEQYINGRTDNNPFLFPGRTESKPCTNASIQKTLKQIGDRAGVTNVHPHRFRRTAATLALRHGMSIEMVSKMLRHERLQTTMVYLDIDDRELMYQHQKYVG